MSTDVNADIDTLAPASNEVVLEDGTEVLINRLKTRETMALLKILTRGAGGALGEMQFSADMDASDFAGSVLAATVLAIPEATDETIEFVRRMVAPKGLITSARLSKPEREINDEKIQHLVEITENPSLDDLVTIVSRVIEIEAPHLQSLGKSLAVLWKSLRTASESRKASSKSA